MAATKPTSVQDFLWDSSKTPLQPFCVIFGDEAYLKAEAARTMRNHVLKDDDSEFSYSRFEGKSADLNVVIKELSTPPMFGGSLRFVMIDDADPFVTRYRTELEDYAENPSKKAILLLLVKSFPANTKLYKNILKNGLLFDAKPMDERSIPPWIVRWARHRHGIKCEPDAAAMILQRIGPEHGMLDQELAKLALMVPPDGTVTVPLVESNVGSWRVQSVFQLLDTAMAGNTGEALRQFDRLILSGEKPITVLNLMAPTLRKYAAATEKILESEKVGRKPNLRGILGEVGVNTYFLDKSEKQLRNLGRIRGAKLGGWLLQADLDLKGFSKIDDRYVIESLIVKISDPRLC